MRPDPALPEPLRVTLQVTRVLEELQIPYFIGGSLASAVHGTIRATIDADLVADLHVDHVQQLVSRLESTFYIDRTALLNALENGSSFNLIHQETIGEFT